jgi:hypothetical protein
MHTTAQTSAILYKEGENLQSMRSAGSTGTDSHRNQGTVIVFEIVHLTKYLHIKYIKNS